MCWLYSFLFLFQTLPFLLWFSAGTHKQNSDGRGSSLLLSILLELLQRAVEEGKTLEFITTNTLTYQPLLNCFKIIYGSFFFKSSDAGNPDNHLDYQEVNRTHLWTFIRAHFYVFLFLMLLVTFYCYCWCLSACRKFDLTYNKMCKINENAPSARC